MIEFILEIKSWGKKRNKKKPIGKYSKISLLVKLNLQLGSIPTQS